MGERFPEGPLTILFSDVEGSTDLRTQRGDTAAHRILRSHEDVVRNCVGEHDGWEVKALGDGFMVAFVSARKALSCARPSSRASASATGDHPAMRSTCGWACRSTSPWWRRFARRVPDHDVAAAG